QPLSHNGAGDAFAPFPLTATQQAYLLGRGDAFPLGGVSTHAYLEFDTLLGRPDSDRPVLDGGLDPQRLRAAWRRLLGRHDMLRAVIDPQAAEQRILPDISDVGDGELGLRTVDLRDASPAEADRALMALRAELSHEVRDPAWWPLFSTVLSLHPLGGARLHVGFDGLTIDYASWHVLYRDLCAYYDNPLRTDEPLPGSFRDYVLCHGETPTAGAASQPGGDADSQLAAARRYWRARLPELPGPPQLPLARDPATVHAGRFRRRAHILDPASWERLRRGAHGAGLTPSAVLLAVYAEVLGRWSRSSRFTVNVPRMNRDPLYPGGAELVGEFASFSLLAVDTSGHAPLRERARTIQRQLWSDLEHAAASGVWVLRELARLRGGLPEAPMPVVLTSTLAWPDEPPSTLDSLLEPGYAISQTPQVYLDVQLEERRGELRCNWDAVEEILPADVLDGMFAAWVGALARLADDPDAWDAPDLVDLPAATADLPAAAATAEPAPRAGSATPDGSAEPSGLLVHELFEAQARQQPQAPAVIAADGRLSYSELYQDATRLARWLHAQPSTAGTPAADGGGADGTGAAGGAGRPPVAVVMDKGRAQIAAALGVLFAGRSYAPIDGTQPPARVAAVLRDCRPDLILVDARCADTVAAALALLDGAHGSPAQLDVDAALYRSAVRPDAGPGPLDGFDDGPLPRTAAPDDLAYVLYTSGSTGTPKGVMIAHRGVVNCLLATRAEFDVGPDDRVLGLTAAHHDMSVFDIFGVLGAGGALVLPDPELRTDPAHWSTLLREHGVTLWNSVPATMEMLLAHVAAGQAEIPATLRLAFLGGDWIPTAAVRDLARLAPGLELVSVGGPTETTLWNIWHRVVPGDADGPSVPYGRPIPGARYHLLNEAGRQCPPLVVGEMCCTGVGLARGYWNDEARTAAAFTTHPRTGERMYRTGDLDRYRPDGVLEFVGRRDQQVKIRGHRVEPAEVEAALAAHPGLRAAVVTPVAHPGRAGHRALTGWVLRDPQHADALPADVVTAAATLTEHLRSRLPAALVPGRIVVLDRFPLAANGKVDRAALATREQAPAAGDATVRPGTTGGGVTEGGALAAVLAGLWAEVLGGPIPPSGGNFFEFGGDSLAATRILARLRAVFTGEEISLRSLLVEPTVGGAARALAAATEPGRLESLALRHLEAGQLTAEQTASAAIGSVEPTPGGPLGAPLSSAQRRFWFLHRMAPASSAYHLSVGARLRGPLDVDALGAALRDVVDRHEVLRTVYPAADADQPHQLVLDRPAAQLLTLAVRELPAAETPEAAARAFGQEPIDLAGEIPLRAQLLRTGPDEHVLQLVVAHIACDDLSWAILFADLAVAYRARVDGTEPDFGPPPARYRDHARLEADPRHHADIDRDLVWWRETLTPAPPPLAAALASTPAPAGPGRSPGARGATDRPALRRGRTLSGADATRLRAFARAHDTSPYVVLLAAATILLYRSTGADDIAVGAPVAARPRPELEGVVGNFGNTLVLRTRVDGRQTLAGLVGQVREVTLAAWTHQHAPFDDVVRELRRRGDAHGAGADLFDVMFSYRSRALGDFALSGLTTEELPVHNGTARFPLVLEAVEHPDAFGLTATVDATVFTAADAERLVGRLARLCEQIGDTAADTPVGELDTMSAQERRLVVDGWSGGGTQPLVERTLAELVADQTRRTPDAVAVVGHARPGGPAAADGTGSPAAARAADVTLTYAELERRAEALGARLRAAGVGPEVTVGVCVPRSAALIVALLGVLRAGGAFVPLETSWPARRIAEVARGAGIGAVVAGAAIALPDLTDPGVVVSRLDSAGRLAGPAEQDPANSVAGPVAMENLAYVIYTSGSTGAPKGVMIRHQAICNRLRWQVGMLGLTGDDVVLHKAPLGFDISINEIFLPLVAGARLVVAPPEAEGDPGELMEIISRHGVTFFYVVASMLGVLLERPDAAPAGRSLRHVWCGGEALGDELYERFRQRWDARMYHGYGPAEATIGVSCRVFEPGERDARVSIGRPNPNTRIRVLDAGYQPVPVGAVGELFISGLPLARGYINDPRRTADRFVPDPFSTVPGSRMYSTGDLARFRADGEIEFLGRSDNQVKIRGFRVELEEIEHVLGRHPGVRQAVVVLAPGPAGTSQMRAYYAGRSTGGGVPDGTTLRAWLTDRLPRHMIPDVCAAVPDLPLTTAGKIDRRAVAAFEPPQPARAGDAGTAFVAPAAGLERQIAEIWAQVLGVERVGTRDNFFSLGGHSLLLIRVQTQMEQRLGRRVAVLDLFAHTTVEQLARLLRSDPAAPVDPARPGPPTKPPAGLAPPADPLLDDARNRANRRHAALRARRIPAGRTPPGPTPPHRAPPDDRTPPDLTPPDRTSPNGTGRRRD
ncbi:non-ribosomal peptide synthetase, partial [Frankia tisae]|uniref:non-ribosomal peptide synthetase n=1 Tax=Frankia tisae TaxID=2950104 RepID=UPI0021BF8EE8